MRNRFVLELPVILLIGLSSACSGTITYGMTDGAIDDDWSADGSVSDGGSHGRDASQVLDGGTDAAGDAASDAATASDASAGRDAAGGAASGRSAGCGKAATGTGEFDNRSAQIMGRERTYHVRIPSSYEPSRAYPVVFRFHGYGGDGLSGGLGIEFVAGDDMLVVAPDGLDQGWDDGSKASDLALFDAMYSAIGDAYCVDLGRVYAYGFSMGGGMTNLLSCERAAKLRATASIAGFDRGTGTCSLPVASWFLHDRDDDQVPVTDGQHARDRMVSRNGCSTQTMDDGDGCVRYQGCKEGYPVVYCETSGNGHNIAGSSAPQAVWSFFSSLAE